MASTNTASENGVSPVSASYSACGPEKWFQNTVGNHSTAAGSSPIPAANGTIPCPFNSSASPSSSSLLFGGCRPISSKSVLLKYRIMV